MIPSDRGRQGGSGNNQSRPGDPKICDTLANMLPWS
eukprot:CAMPEP_0177167260 /NCGR_PEP_ID=MMETSP0367-20130122/8459_1 /TAXON_ID=447022 ORGANISM="Scrippsiella hangoei-like, Strain SHHI-4" /NCGR_SAMPLE_ID=MMETSP0367 /ASSEMBLY_ACC=CAM_ASM_000362 /LENGTH=35 /DNA_ID= /DNA_START= /DNA_END= /DNA_ORIENTATION=